MEDTRNLGREDTARLIAKRRPFVMAEAMVGAPLTTRGGVPAEFVGVAHALAEPGRVLATVGGTLLRFLENGMVVHGTHDLDLVMAPRTVFANLLHDGSAEHYPTRERAIEESKGYKASALLVVAFPVELPE